MQPGALADLDQLADGVAQAVRKVVVAKDGGRARVRQDVRIALVQVVPWERPVVQRGARVVVLRARAQGGILGGPGWGCRMVSRANGSIWSPCCAPASIGTISAHHSTKVQLEQPSTAQ